MVFSFFKKDPKETRGGAQSGTRSPVRPVRADTGSRPPGTISVPNPNTRTAGRSSSAERHTTGGAFAVTENALPDREMARSLAMATAKKIDAIESEMTRDFLRPRTAAGANGETQPPREPPPVEAAPAQTPQASASAARRTPITEQSEEDAFDPGSEILAGSIDAIEVNGGSSSLLDETAILFANRQDAAAESGLRTALAGETLGPLTERGWLMLLELLQQRGDRAAYDQLAAQFATRFGSPAPAWISYGDAEKRAAPQLGMPSVQLPASIDASIVKPLEEFKILATSNPALTLDVSATRFVDLVGAELLLRVFNAFKRASHELYVRGPEALLVALRSAVEPGRRDSSDAAWMLLLEVQRLLDRQADFEETGIQYCITYEVSPPSWEPPVGNIHVSGAGDAPAGRAAEAIEWKGEIAGDGDQYLGRLALAAQSSRALVVECRQLRRMAFTAASSLLGQLLKLQQSGVSVEFRNVNSLVCALWQLLGVTAMADVHIRRT